MKSSVKAICHNFYKSVLHPDILSLLATLIVTSLSFYSPELFALNSTDEVAELKNLTTEVGKLSKVACYIIGTASAAIGTLWAVGSQSLKVAAGSGAITILAFKAPAFFSQSMII